MRTASICLAHCGTFLVGMLSVALLTASLDELPFWSWGRAKMAEATRTGSGYDILFVGSSRMGYGVIPEIFDATLREAGLEHVSFNAALAGARPHDFTTMIEFLARAEPRTVRTMVVELHNWETGFRDGNWMSDMEIELHSMTTWPRRARSTLQSSLPWSGRLFYVAYDLAHCAANLLRLGQGARILTDVRDRRNGKSPNGVWAVADRGFIAQELIDFEEGRRDHAEFLARAAYYREMLETKRRRQSGPSSGPAFDVNAWIAQDALIKSYGIHPVFIVMPSYFDDMSGMDGIEALPQHIDIVRMDRVSEQIDLYADGNWYDGTHMTSKGAADFSRRLAKSMLLLRSFGGGR